MRFPWSRGYRRAPSGLFGMERRNFTHRLTSILAGGDLEEPATSEEFSQVRTEGKRQVDGVSLQRSGPGTRV